MDDLPRKNRSASRRTFLKTGATASAFGILGASAEQSFAREQTPIPNSVQPSSPDWIQDLIVYEVATKGFTSPHGPESGTFTSLKAKLPYLQDLGITGIWLTGHSLADPHFFYNIWTQYANIDPGKIDPSLGTPQEFKALIADAHAHGIRIFLDVHTHGILSFSPVIKEHPHWFRGGIWHMTDYDWYGGHTDLDEWWVGLWTNYVTEYGVDGFRLDYRIFRPDLWERIRRNAAAAGHEIVIFEEDDAVIPGVTDFTQHDHNLRIPPPGSLNPHLVNNVPGFYDRIFGRKGYYKVEVRFDDGTRATGDTAGAGSLRVQLKGLTEDKSCRRVNDVHADGIPDVQLTVGNVTTKLIGDVIVTDDMGGEWHLQPGKNHRLLNMDGNAPALQLYIATLAPGLPCIMLSCHDEGWEGFPEDKSPYVAQGSRALFGYSCLFMPMIPIFFAGEEFDATYRPIPWLSPHLWGGGELGTGKWLYGTMLDWSELAQPEHAAMLQDVKEMIAVRKQEADILALRPANREPNLIAVPHQGDIEVPVPYLRHNQQSAIIIAANRETNRDAHLQVNVPLEELGWVESANYTVSYLWPAMKSRSCSGSELKKLEFGVNRDKTRHGGLRVIRIVPKA